MTAPLISIVICSHNRAGMLPTTLDSVMAQEYQPTEIIVLDDGSTDDTADVIGRYGDAIRYHRQENQGITAARTNACRLASGEYIAFIDDDDLMPPRRLTTLLKALLDFPEAVFATGDFEEIDDQGTLTGKRWLPAAPDKPGTPILIQNGHEAVLWPRVAATVHTCLFRRRDGESIGWFNQAFRYASEDKDFFARLGLLGPIVHVPEVVSWYRRGHASLTCASLDVRLEQLALFAEHIKKLGAGQQALRQRLDRRILRTLVGISRARHQATRLSRVEADRRISNALKLLPLAARIRLHWQVRIKGPLTRLIRRRSGGRSGSQ
jgi:glycosyltransferase involved in cell wall biosynthesis